MEMPVTDDDSLPINIPLRRLDSLTEIVRRRTTVGSREDKKTPLEEITEERAPAEEKKLSGLSRKQLESRNELKTFVL